MKIFQIKRKEMADKNDISIHWLSCKIQFVERVSSFFTFTKNILFITIISNAGIIYTNFIYILFIFAASWKDIGLFNYPTLRSNPSPKNKIIYKSRF